MQLSGLLLIVYNFVLQRKIFPIMLMCGTFCYFVYLLALQQWLDLSKPAKKQLRSKCLFHLLHRNCENLGVRGSDKDRVCVTHVAVHIEF